MSTTESKTASTITEREAAQIDRANATDVAPVVFVLVLATSVVSLACSLAATAAGRAPGASFSGP